MLRIPPFLSCVALVCVIGCDQQNPLAPTGLIVAAPPAQTAPIVRQLDPQGVITAPDGSRIVYRSNGQPGPRPTVLVLTGIADDAFTAPSFAPFAAALVGAGWLAVSIDLPAHGEDRRANEDAHNGFDGWYRRLFAGEDIAASFTNRASRALDLLIAAGYADPAHIVVAGFSRGGFMALHTAAVDPRIGAAVVFVPVTDLSVVGEFQRLYDQPLLLSLGLHQRAAAIARVPVWAAIGANDERVSTPRCIAFVEAVQASGGQVDFRIEPVDGHTFTPAAVAEAVAWVQSR